MANPVLKISVNRNKTKEGVKVQFVFPTNIEGDQKAEMTQKLQSKLNAGLGKFGLTINQDTDVPFSNVIGFLIPIADFKIMIKNAIGGGGETPAPEMAPEEEIPAPEEPVKEIKRMQKLAGLKENVDQDKLKQYYGYLLKLGGGDLAGEYGDMLDRANQFNYFEEFVNDDIAILAQDDEEQADEIKQWVDSNL